MEEHECQATRLDSMLDVYQLKLRQARNFETQWRNQKTMALREEFRSRANRLEVEAGYIAHCIALLGNLPLPETDSDILRGKLNLIASLEFDPWRRGLAILNRYLNSGNLST